MSRKARMRFTCALLVTEISEAGGVLDVTELTGEDLQVWVDATGHRHKDQDQADRELALRILFHQNVIDIEAEQVAVPCGACGTESRKTRRRARLRPRDEWAL